MPNEPTDIQTEMIIEIRDRTKRLETRVTKWLGTQGFDTRVRRAAWAAPGEVDVPSPACSLKEILECIPPTWAGPVIVSHEGRSLCYVHRPH
jgi:hypothetical protein